MGTMRDISLKDLLEIFTKRLPILILAAIIALVASILCVPLLNQHKYESTATLYLGSPVGENDYNLALKLIDDCSYLLTSHSVLEQVILDLDLDVSEKSLAEDISIKNPASTRILEVTVTASDPTMARKIANSVCLIGRDKISATMGFYQVAIHEMGTYSETPCNKISPLLYTFLAMAAVAVTYDIYLLLYLMDNRLRSAEEAEQLLNIPVFAEIPVAVAKNKKRTLDTAYQQLRANLLFAGKDKQIFVLTSCGKKSGRSPVALNLAESLADMRKRVLLIDCDFRSNPEKGEEHYIRTKGLNEVLNGDCLLNDVLNPRKNDRLHILLSGEVPTDPAGLLASELFCELLEDVRQQYDIVLLDMAPLGLYVDAAVAAANSDGILFCVGEQEAQKLQAAAIQLQRSSCPLIGLIWQKGLK